MKFIPWSPKGQNKIVRVYISDFKGVSIGRLSGILSLGITKATQQEAQQINAVLSGQGIELDTMTSISHFVSELESKGLIQGKSKVVNINSKAMDNIINDVLTETADYAKPNNSFTPAYRTRSLAQLSNDTTKFDIRKIPMLSKTRKNLLVELDHREPHGIADILRSAGIRVDIVALAEGDVKVTLEGNDSQEMLWERKTISDLSASIQSQNRHAHDQCERMNLFREHRMTEGCSVGVFWIYEYQNNAQTSLYSGLELTQSTDGWLSYVQAICGQQVVHSFNEYHSACLILKFSQGYFEQELRNKVTIKSSGVRVDRTKSERIYVHDQLTGESPDKAKSPDTGVTRPAQGVGGILASFPGLSVKAAKSLAGTGRSMSQIMQMSVDEMVLLDGIGKKTANHIYSLFHLVD